MFYDAYSSRTLCTPIPIYSDAHVLHLREKKGEKHGWILWKIAFIHCTGNNRQFFRATALSRGLQGAHDPLTEFTSISESCPSPFEPLEFTHTHLILTRFSSSTVGRLLTSALACSSNTLEVWTCKLRMSAWWNGMRQSETMDYAKKVEYKLVFRKRKYKFPFHMNKEANFTHRFYLTDDVYVQT